MSTVLWANKLVRGEVTALQSDLYALNRYLDKLDGICRDLGLTPISEFCDSTDTMVNVGQLEMPDDMESTDELMARDGQWIEAAAALTILEQVLEKIVDDQTRFGMLSNAHDDVVEELRESIEFAKQADGESAKFNFAIVM